MKKLFENIDVFKREKDKLVIYRCFKIVGADRYFVQNADHFYFPIENQQLRQSEHRMLELFFEEDIEERIEGYSTLAEAIKNFDKDFGN